MLKAKAISLSILVIWGIIICILYLKESNDAASRNSVVVEVTKVPKNEQQGKENEPKVEAKTEKNEKPSEQTASKEDVQIAMEEPAFKGEIMRGQLCLDTLEHKSGNVGLWECHSQGGNQYWHLTKNHLLKNNDICIRAQGENENDNLARLEPCNDDVKEQKWIYKDNLLKLSDTERCLDGADRNGLKVLPCNKDSENQKFKVSPVSKELGA